MGKYTIKDFIIGDEVYHLSNKELRMVVIKIHQDHNQISCSWLKKDGERQQDMFLPEELGKSNDLGPKVMSINITA